MSRSAVGVRNRRAALLGALLVLALVAPSGASAFYGNGADLVSADYSRLEQGDDTTVFAGISSDGRYVVIQTRSRNFFADDDPDPPGRYRVGGLFRFDLATRVLVKVANGDLLNESDNSVVYRGASSPSVSADGRHVAFSTAEPLAPLDTNGNVDVYVRDLTLAIGQPGAFELVSARTGGDVPASYGPSPNPTPQNNPGSELSRGVAMSADARYVAFRTDIESDLPAQASANVPPGQIFVRDRQLDTTTLVTRTDPGGDPAGGALGAAISADGSTVAWTGSNAPAQTRFLNGENPDLNFNYYLWRRIADGPSAPTRRITGLADPDDPACDPGAFTFFDASSTGPCFGPLTDQEESRASINSLLPVMSPDGYTVAFLTGAGPRPLTSTGAGLDLFLTSMRPGLSRKGATTELTRDSSSTTASGSTLTSLAMDPAGRYVAFTTSRTQFTLPALRLQGAARAVPSAQELYVADTQTGALERVARATDGGDTNGDVRSGVTLSAGAEKVAFTSFAGNLFFGDANARPDAFVAEREPEVTEEPPVIDENVPPGTIVTDQPRIRLSARSLTGGRVKLTVRVLAAGGIKAEARARAGRPRKLRTLGVASARAKAAGKVQMTLRPVRRYLGELSRRGRIKANIRVTFVPARGGKQARAAVPVTFKGPRK